MVAYSFNAMFVAQVEAGVKRQTVRAHRKRHARVGEPIQLYQAQRTKWCRKIVDPDPICTNITPIDINVTERGHLISMISLDGMKLGLAAQMEFAKKDGFDPSMHPPEAGNYISTTTPLFLMGQYWLESHGAGLFHMVVIEWEPQS
ncbi:MAG: ASCH domain-containing protein [Rhizobiaceae bacterium]